jgi:hypothetical protein
MKGAASAKAASRTQPPSGRQGIREITKKDEINSKSTETSMPSNG